MGFYYKNFFVSLVACAIAFGGFLSTVYSFEGAKSAAKATQANQVASTISTPGTVKQYDNSDIVKAREMMIAVQQTILAEEKARIAQAQQNLDLKMLEYQQKVGTQKNTVPVVKKTPVSTVSSQTISKLSLSSVASIIPLSDIPSLTPITSVSSVATTPLSTIVIPTVTMSAPIVAPVSIPVTSVPTPVAPVPTPITTPVVTTPTVTTTTAPRTTVS